MAYRLISTPRPSSSSHGDLEPQDASIVTVDQPQPGVAQVEATVTGSRPKSFPKASFSLRRPPQPSEAPPPQPEPTSVPIPTFNFVMANKRQAPMPVETLERSVAEEDDVDDDVLSKIIQSHEPPSYFLSPPLSQADGSHGPGSSSQTAGTSSQPVQVPSTFDINAWLSTHPPVLKFTPPSSTKAHATVAQPDTWAAEDIRIVLEREEAQPHLDQLGGQVTVAGHGGGPGGAGVSDSGEHRREDVSAEPQTIAGEAEVEPQVEAPAPPRSPLPTTRAAPRQPAHAPPPRCFGPRQPAHAPPPPPVLAPVARAPDAPPPRHLRYPPNVVSVFVGDPFDVSINDVYDNVITRVGERGTVENHCINNDEIFFRMATPEQAARVYQRTEGVMIMSSTVTLRSQMYSLTTGKVNPTSILNQCGNIWCDNTLKTREDNIAYIRNS